MTDFDEFERRLAAAIRSDADQSVGPFTPGSVARAAIADTGPAAVRVGRSSRRAGRFGRGRGLTLLAAAAVLLVGGAVAGSALVRQALVVPPVPAPSVAVLATESPEATTTTTPTPTAPATPSPTPGLDVTWTQLPIGVQFAAWNDPRFSPRLAWIGDRFVLADVKSGAVTTSSDGRDWQAPPDEGATQSYIDLLRGSVASWQDSAVAWWNPQEEAQCMNCAGAPPITARDVVEIIRPPAAPISTTPFKGRIESLGIGPKGIFAQVHSHLDLDRWITKKLGLRTNNDWTCCVKDLTFKDGVLELKLTNRKGLKVVWADQGFQPGDIFDAGFGWYSPDGKQWTMMPPNDAEYPSQLPTGTFGSVVGVSDGFIATGTFPKGTCDQPDGSCAGIWHSSDGLTWRILGTAPQIESNGKSLCIRDACSALSGALVPWRGGALAIAGDGSIGFWTSAGPTELPLAVHEHGTVGIGPLGFVSVGDDQARVSRDGMDSKVSSLPAPMAAQGIGQGGSRVVAVGDRTVLVLERQWVGEPEMTQSLWLGTFEP